MKRTAPIVGPQSFTRTVTPCRESHLKEISIYWKRTHWIVLIVLKVFLSLFVRVNKQLASEPFGHLTVAAPSVCILHCWSQTPTICLTIPLCILSSHPCLLALSPKVWPFGSCAIYDAYKSWQKKTENIKGGGSFSIQKRNESHFCCTRAHFCTGRHTQVCVYKWNFQDSYWPP